jgi:hypothetical protein
MDLALRAFYRVPVFGRLTKDAVKGAPGAKYYFLANIAVFYAFALYVFGYPLLIVTLLAATALALTTIIALTAADAISNSVRSRRKGRKPA